MKTTNIREEADRIKDYLGSVRFGTKRTTVYKIAKQVLLDGWFTRNGRFIQPKAKSIGCGVYEIWGEELNPS